MASIWIVVYCWHLLLFPLLVINVGFRNYYILLTMPGGSSPQGRKPERTCYQRKITDSFISIERKNSYHPIKEYLEGLVWDKTPRIETLFIDYLWAENTPYTRTVTKKSLCAATARIFNPGIKFDYALVLLGKQGIGKSELIGLLGQRWYSDSFYTVLGKEAYEQLREAWIIEIPELSALKKAEAEAAKHFISIYT